MNALDTPLTPAELAEQHAARITRYTEFAVREVRRMAGLAETLPEQFANVDRANLREIVAALDIGRPDVELALNLAREGVEHASRGAIVEQREETIILAGCAAMLDALIKARRAINGTSAFQSLTAAA